MGMGGRALQLFLLLLLASAFTMLPLLFRAVTLQHLLLLEFGVIPLVLYSANLVGLSGLGSVSQMVLIK